MKFEFSAGGIVFKKENNHIWILTCQSSQHHGWVFPKGLIGDHQKTETKEETALREVQEETGVKAQILRSLSPTTYWFVWNNEKTKKTVYYFLMEYLSGNIMQHDKEMEKVEWLPIDEVKKRLTYNSDKEIWHETKQVIVARLK